MAQPLTQLEANRLRQSLGTKLANEARSRGVAADPIRKQYIFTPTPTAMAPTAKVKARALLGGQEFETFSIDLTKRRHIDAPVDHVSMKPIIDHETLRDLPSVPTTPIEHHLADKICALYERHGQDGDEASTRYRDLADIVRIVAAIPFDAARLTTVLEREAGRRQMTLPKKAQAPSEDWIVGFPRSAARFAEYPQEYWDLNAALTFCSTCLDEILNGERTSGTWDPDRRSWQ